MIFVGDDWSEGSHAVFVMGEDGSRVWSGSLPEAMAGIGRFHQIVVDAGVDDPADVVVGIETDRGLWVNSLVASGYQVYAINPKAAKNFRDYQKPGGGKSDRGDAAMLADLVRNNQHNHRLIAADSDHIEGIRILARAHQNLVWERTRQMNRLRHNLLEYFPTAEKTFRGGLASTDALGVLALAPTPKAAARLTKPQIRGALKRGGRQRNLERFTVQYQAGLRAEQLHLVDVTADSFGAVTMAIVAIIGSLNTEIERLASTLETTFRAHPDADKYLSLPGVGVITSARMLGEFGDDPERYASAKSRKNYAGTSPLTDASGKYKQINARYVRNKRLADAIQHWAHNAHLQSDGAAAFHQQQITAGRTHHQALRALGNKLVGHLHGCLQHNTHWDEHTAWKHQTKPKQIQQAA